MKVEVKKEDKHIRPLEITLTLETKREMLMLAAVFNSTHLLQTLEKENDLSDIKKLRNLIGRHLEQCGITEYYSCFGTGEIPDWAK